MDTSLDNSIKLTGTACICFFSAKDRPRPSFIRYSKLQLIQPLKPYCQMLAGKAKPVRNYMGAILAEPQANVIDV